MVWKFIIEKNKIKYLFLGSREVIQVRRSQIKFECDHYDLEVIDYSKPCNLTLNRQVITLLSSLGVQDVAFLHIQNEARLRATMALLKCREAISLLDKVRFFEFEKISNSGSKFFIFNKIYILNKRMFLFS